MPSGEIICSLLRDITASFQADAAIETREPGRISGNIAATDDGEIDVLGGHRQLNHTPMSVPFAAIAVRSDALSSVSGGPDKYSTLCPAHDFSSRPSVHARP